jgi:hypothetical protein
MEDGYEHKRRAAVLCPLIAVFPSPGQPGRLVINSTPEQGATITINGKVVRQLTNTTFVVPPRNYKLSVTSRNGSINCPQHDVWAKIQRSLVLGHCGSKSSQPE